MTHRALNGFRVITISGLVSASLFFSACGENRMDTLMRDLASENIDTRERAAAALIEVGSPAIPSLHEMMRHPDPAMRKTAFETIIKIDKAEATRHPSPTLTDLQEKIPGIYRRNDTQYKQLRQMMRQNSGFSSRHSTPPNRTSLSEQLRRNLKTDKRP
jgi:hypothetical protein